MNDTFIIAEVGINHNGDIEIAKQLIDIAKKTGCDAVKFQKRTVDVVYTPEELAKPRVSPWGDTNGAQKYGLEFENTEYTLIDRYCKKIGIDWFASCWDIGAQKFIQQYNCKFNKVASAMLTDKALTELIASEGKYTFISTGMSTMEEIAQVVHIFTDLNCPFELMHCNSQYPLADKDANLMVMNTLAEEFDVPVGYSGHEVGVITSVAAVAMGATSIERHITLDRAMYGSDQSASLEPQGLQKLVEYIRVVETAFGDGIKRVSEAEENCKAKLRRC